MLVRRVSALPSRGRILLLPVQRVTRRACPSIADIAVIRPIFQASARKSALTSWSAGSIAATRSAHAGHSPSPCRTCWPRGLAAPGVSPPPKARSGSPAAARPVRGCLLHRLGMPASADTVLRLVRAIPLPECATPRVLGVDDWALKKGQTYGTILVDLEVRRVVDLLPDRTAQTLAKWLEGRDTVEGIARDRSTEYALGATLGGPAAVQVVDRWRVT